MRGRFFWAKIDGLLVVGMLFLVLAALLGVIAIKVGG
jgi:hypothetical protein